MKSHLHRILSAAAGLARVASVTGSVTARAEENVASSSEFVQCVGSVCEGDSVRIYSGEYAGYNGRVVDVDSYNYSATVLLDIGGYITVDARDLSVVNRPYPQPRPYPRPQYCPPGYIYDVYRGCVRIVRPVPPPRRYPAPYPPRRYPAPVPPRRYPAPVPPRGYPQPQPPRHGYPSPGHQPGQGGSPGHQPGQGGHPGGGGHHGPGRRG
jgi:hypothetical protein